MSFHVERHTSQLEKAPRATRACGLCHARKVKCDVSSTKLECSNCYRDGQVCRQRARQRRAYPAKPKSKLSSWRREPSSDISRAPTVSTQPLVDAGTVASPMTLPLANLGETSQEKVSQVVHQGPYEPVLADSPSTGSDYSPCGSYEGGYMARSAYIAPEKYGREDGFEINYTLPAPSEAMQQMAKLQNAFEMPPRAIRESLFENFWTYCYPWDPIVSRSQTMNAFDVKPSPILLQAVFLAGSRMLSSSHPHTFASPEGYYTRAKTLFWLDYEKDPMNLLVATSLMHWWNPHGPERVSINTSSFWCRITVSLAHQMGLHSTKKAVPDEPRRRRVWWSIVARDLLISVAHGRPQAINLEDCDVPLPNIDDFPDAPSTGLFFIAYVELSLIIGRFTLHKTRRSCTKEQPAGIEDSLYRWAKNLPESLHLRRQPRDVQCVRPPSLQSRQLNVLYLTMIILLYRSSTAVGEPFPTVIVIAASSIAGLFEDFLARDEVRYLGPCFSFHLLAASIALLSCYRYPELWSHAQEDLKILTHAQEEMKKSWPSAIGSMSSFDRMFKLTETCSRLAGLPMNTLTPFQAVFFENCDLSLCRMYSVLTDKPQVTVADDPRESQIIKPLSTAMNLTGDFSEMMPMSQAYQLSDDGLTQAILDLPPNTEGQMPFEQMFQEESGQANGAIGDWLFWDELAFDAN